MFLHTARSFRDMRHKHLWRPYWILVGRNHKSWWKCSSCSSEDNWRKLLKPCRRKRTWHRNCRCSGYRKKGSSCRKQRKHYPLSGIILLCTFGIQSSRRRHSSGRNQHKHSGSCGSTSRARTSGKQCCLCSIHSWTGRLCNSFPVSWKTSARTEDRVSHSCKKRNCWSSSRICLAKLSSRWE